MELPRLAFFTSSPVAQMLRTIGRTLTALLVRFHIFRNIISKDIQRNLPGEFTSDVLNSLRTNPSVDYIAEDGIMHAMSAVTQYMRFSSFLPSYLDNLIWM